MKKLFTLIVALLGLTSYADAASVSDLQLTKHSYVMVADDYTNAGTGARTRGGLFGDDHFWDVTGGSVSPGRKGSIDLSTVDDYGIVTEYYQKKYGEYGEHFNSLRLKNKQDVIALKVAAGSKIIIFYQNNSKDRYPYFATDKDLANPTKVQGKITAGKDVEGVDKAHGALARIEWTADDDYTTDNNTLYIGSHGGDMYLSYIIVEANEAPGTPTIKVGKQDFADGLYFKEVSITANDASVEGQTTKTAVLYTTDGTDPNTSTTAKQYTAPFKVYQKATIKAQAYMDFEGTGKVDKENGYEGMEEANNEANVNFKFNAPTIEDDGNGNVTVTSEYEGATNVISYGDQQDIESSTATLSESAIVSAYSIITNGSYGEFETPSASKPVYVLNAIKEATTFEVKNDDVEVDQENTTPEETVYKFKDGLFDAQKMTFFVQNPKPKVVSDAKYQVDADSVYYQMGQSDNITFKVAAGDSVDVVVTTSLNSCKNIEDTTSMEKDGVTYKNLHNFVNVNGTNYGFDNTPEKFENVIKFGLKAGDADEYFTFKKYSGTGNILVKSIVITPAKGTTGITNVNAEKKANFKTVKVIENGQLVIKTANGTFTVAGARLK